MHRPMRRRSGYGPHLCATAAALVLLLFSLLVLYSRLSSPTSFPLHLPISSFVRPLSPPQPRVLPSALFSDDSDPDSDAFDNALVADDRIDELDVLEDDEDHGRRSVEEEFTDDLDFDDPELASQSRSSSNLFWDHALGVARRSFGKPSERRRLPDHPWLISRDDRREIVFGSDDQAVVDEDFRVKLDSIRQIEDALLLKIGGSESPLRKGWSHWLEGKGDFLRRDRMLRSNLELLNPKNHPLLQDPDGLGLSALTRGDRLMQRVLLKEMEEIPFPSRESGDGSKTKRVEGRKALHDQNEQQDNLKGKNVALQEEHIFADGRHWGYYPGLDPHLSFSDFMDQFLGDGRCPMRVFMVWNSPPWMYGIRHQRGLESLLHHHKDACVVVFTETMELDFFREFVKDGFKVAVAMPNLDELLLHTPTYDFASAWYYWRKTKYYPIHYSELIRLAALYKYGGIYLDSDVIVLNPIHSLKNSIGAEEASSEHPIFNGAVMAFEKNSTFILECLEEFYSTYNGTLLRWNGADLVTRVISRLSSNAGKSSVLHDVKRRPSFAFYPISSSNITRYFAEPADDFDATLQDALLKRMLDESLTFHLWSSLTSSLVPESNSLVDKLLNRYCIRCLDVL